MAVGRPPFEVTPDVLAQAEEFAAQGSTQKEIAQLLGIGMTTLCKYKKDDSGEFTKFTKAIKKGEARAIQEVTNALHNKAKSGDTTSMIFFLKNRNPEDWQDRRDVRQEVTGPDGGPLVVLSDVERGAKLAGLMALAEARKQKAEGKG